ncbi:SMP-30/gluconolactonase/LRE family protein [Gordonia sp. UBA6683]|uniref:SMP-30/gluconolactonase/LRE family protein n=1 Tax=Gordonia sp. UBA6683 TaxID=1946577 RepID=UPI0039C88296
MVSGARGEVRQWDGPRKVGSPAALGEGPVWDAEANLMYWVDILNGRLLATDVEGAETTTVYESRSPVSSVALVQGGGLLASCLNEIILIEGRNSISVSSLNELAADMRFNDCGVDPAGRYMVGTLDPLGKGRGCLYRMSGSGELAVVLSGVSISNGIDWSPCGNWMYYVDTPTRVISRYRYDCGSGEFDTSSCDRWDLSGYSGVPDGLWVDSEGRILVAMWDGGSLLRLGEWGCSDVEVVTVPCLRPTSGAFFGGNLDSVFLTAAALDNGARVRPLVFEGAGSGRLPNRVDLS